MKIAVARSMLRSVARLDDASNMVNEWLGLVLDGSMTGNIARPTVAMIMATDSFDAMKVKPSRRVWKPNATKKGPTMPMAGTSHKTG